jgi:hypothetical protein
MSISLPQKCNVTPKANLNINQCGQKGATPHHHDIKT